MLQSSHSITFMTILKIKQTKHLLRRDATLSEKHLPQCIKAWKMMRLLLFTKTWQNLTMKHSLLFYLREFNHLYQVKKPLKKKRNLLLNKLRKLFKYLLRTILTITTSLQAKFKTKEILDILSQLGFPKCWLIFLTEMWIKLYLIVWSKIFGIAFTYHLIIKTQLDFCTVWLKIRALTLKSIF